MFFILAVCRPVLRLKVYGVTGAQWRDITGSGRLPFPGPAKTELIESLNGQHNWHPRTLGICRDQERLKVSNLKLETTSKDPNCKVAIIKQISPAQKQRSAHAARNNRLWSIESSMLCLGYVNIGCFRQHSYILGYLRPCLRAAPPLRQHPPCLWNAEPLSSDLTRPRNQTGQLEYRPTFHFVIRDQTSWPSPCLSPCHEVLRPQTTWPWLRPCHEVLTSAQTSWPSPWLRPCHEMLRPLGPLLGYVLAMRCSPAGAHQLVPPWLCLGHEVLRPVGPLLGYVPVMRPVGPLLGYVPVMRCSDQLAPPWLRPCHEVLTSWPLLGYVPVMRCSDQLAPPWLRPCPYVASVRTFSYFNTCGYLRSLYLLFRVYLSRGLLLQKS
ncbi:hypothetical protein J6590_004188 [Homalodisca vitripennis]|nr:hypothetical protein J6590_004188 [Homalodisca vitripennis]